MLQSASRGGGGGLGAWSGGGAGARSGGVPGLGGEGVCSGGCLLPGGSAARGGLLPGTGEQGISLLGGVPGRGVGIPACTEADTPPPSLWTDRRL